MPAPSPAPRDRGDNDQVEALHDLVLRSLEDDQAQELISIPLAGKSSIADHMVIASGRSTRQVASMAQKLAERIKKEIGCAFPTEGVLREIDVRGLHNGGQGLLQSFEDREILRHFLKHGGKETILSYGLDRKTYSRMKMSELQEAMKEAVPKKDRKFLASFEDMIVIGDYVFVHAGINPKLGLDEQKPSDLRWIRERFLKHEEAFSHVVVHGHTIFEEMEHREHRIGIDTGAFRTGRLTALVLEGTNRRTIQAIAEKGGYDFGEVDWDEFYAVVRGEGPVAKERMAARRAAWDDGAWVREAAAAHEAKRQSRAAA